jgi:hypothetical protein
MPSAITRRHVLTLLTTAALVPAAVACSKPELNCSDAAGLTPDELAARSAAAYVDKSADPAKPCSTCKLYQPKSADACGGCSLIKGPINPNGGCKSWAPKAA